MKTKLLIIAFIFVAFGTTRAQLSVSATGQKLVTLNDKVNKNQFVWVSEAPLENTKGSSEGVSGTLALDPQHLASLHGTVTTQVKTMKTGNEQRDNHLLSPQWLDAAKYPTISFTITSVSNITSAGNTATGIATGSFTMHGVSKEMAIPFKLTYLTENAKTRERAPGDLVMFSSDFTIALKDFHVAGTEGVIGSKVGETIKINAQLFGNTAPMNNEKL